MVNPQMLDYGRNRSSIRQLFLYGRQQAEKVGQENVFDYSLGNPSVPPPKEVGLALKDIIENEPPLKVHGYTPAPGSDACRDAIAAQLSKTLERKFTKRNIFVTCGAAAALMACFRGFTINSKSQFIAIAPYFPEYKCFVNAAGAELVTISPEYGDFQINFEELEQKITPYTQGMIINSPNNPTGQIYSRETLEKVAAILTKKSEEYGHHIYIISDEPYRELIYDNHKIPFIPEIYHNTILCYSYSKTLSLPGDRIGYMCVSDYMEDFDDVCDATTGATRALGYVCAPNIMQNVIQRCASVKCNIAAYNKNRLLIWKELEKMGYECVPPKGAFYLFIKAPYGTSEEFSNKAKEKNLLLVPGDNFGCPGYLRLSYCVDYEMIKRSLPVFKTLIENRE